MRAAKARRNIDVSTAGKPAKGLVGFLSSPPDRDLVDAGAVALLEVQESCDRKSGEKVCECDYWPVVAYGRMFEARGHGLAASGCPQHGATEKHRKAYQIETGLRDAAVSKVVLATWTMPTKRAFETWVEFATREGFDPVGLGGVRGSPRRIGAR